jgi:RND family efflux transporter MFP subunit
MRQPGQQKRRAARLLLSLVPLVLALTLAGCKRASSTAKKTADAPRAVNVTAAALRPMERVVHATGTLSPQEEATLSVKVSGRLEKVSVDLGSAVKRGELIAQLERRDYELRVQQARAAVAQARAAVGLPLEGTEENVNLEQVASVREAAAVRAEAEKNRERVARLSKEGVSSRSELDTVETALAVATTRYASAVEEARTRLAVLAQRRADLALAEQQLADTVIVAPFDGAIQSRFASPGEFLSIGTPLASLVRLDPLRLRLEVPERDSLQVQSRQRVRLHVEGSRAVFTGMVARVSPAINEQNRMLLVEADVPAQPSLRPGLFVRSDIVVSENEPAIAVPTNSVVVFAGIEKVITVDDSKARERVITTGRRGGGWVEVLTGLKAGEAVVLNPGNLRTGQPLKVTEASEPSFAAPGRTVSLHP